MVTVAPVSSPWIPEDDLLLKNAVEAGASLEALAKGAVQFSRRFTFRELRDRWHSLLYDPDISAQASACMVELEHSGSNPPVKFNKLDNSKGSGRVPDKRKIGSIRREYYAMRKRIRSELFNSSDLGFLPEPNLHDCGEHGGDFQGHLTLDNEPRDGNSILRGCISNNFELHETDFDILRRAFPETMEDISPTTAVDNTANAFNAVEDTHTSRNARNNSLYGFPEDVSPVRNNGGGSFELSIEHKDAACMLEDNSGNFEKRMVVEEIRPSQALPNQNLFGSDDSQTKPLPTFESMNDNHQTLSSGFGESQHFNSPDSDDNPSCHIMGFSPLTRLPLWKTMEDISAPAMPVSVDNGDRTQGVEGTSRGPENGDHKRESPGYDVTHSQPLSRDDDNADFINSTAISEGDFADLSDSLLNFSHGDGLLFMDVDGKDTTDKSCYDHLNSLLLSSPNDLQDGELQSIEPESSVVPSAGLETPSAASTIHADQPTVHHEEVNVPTSSVLNPEPLKHNDGNICCALNTEDPEIPCNDDIFLIIHPDPSFADSAKQPTTGDCIEPLSSSADEKDCERGLNVMKGNDSAKSLPWPHMDGPSMSPESGPCHSLVGRAVKSELPDTKCQVPADAKKSLRDPNQRRSTHATPISITDGLLEEDISKVESRVDNPATFREITSNAEAGSSRMTIPESSVKPSTLDQDEPESDNDVPYFSDIEAMILEMDLGPYDEEPYISRKVSRYQFEDSKRTIIRLEQCVRSSMQRAMTSQGALAILYGRHLKHYIQKTEVILGRSTDDVDVDIDLRKEGRANKISRRQAIIKMETDGSFSLKNLGKNSISVNGKAVATGQLLTLSSSCLIEIRGMSFVFEINHKSVRQLP